jgi:alkyl hydroperoxide reductase subunit AhpC
MIRSIIITQERITIHERQLFISSQRSVSGFAIVHVGTSKNIRGIFIMGKKKTIRTLCYINAQRARDISMQNQHRVDQAICQQQV